MKVCIRCLSANVQEPVAGWQHVNDPTKQLEDIEAINLWPPFCLNCLNDTTLIDQDAQKQAVCSTCHTGTGELIGTLHAVTYYRCDSCGNVFSSRKRTT